MDQAYEMFHEVLVKLFNDIEYRSKSNYNAGI